MTYNVFIHEDVKDSRDPKSSPERLNELADHTNLFVLTNVARNPNTAAETFIKLIDKINCRILSKRPNTVVDFHLISHYVSRNPNTPLYLKQYLHSKQYLIYYGLS